MAKAKLLYYYDTMNSGKSLDLLRFVYNFEQRGKKVLVFTSDLDARYGKGYAASRAGLKREAILIQDNTDIYSMVADMAKDNRISKIFIDECQFLKEKHIFQLVKIVDELKLTVLCYGLKNDFQNNLFEGSQALLRLADVSKALEPSVCWHPDCDNDAIMVLRMENGKPVYTGEQIQIGGNESYLSVCRKHYYNPDDLLMGNKN